MPTTITGPSSRVRHSYAPKKPSPLRQAVSLAELTGQLSPPGITETLRAGQTSAEVWATEGDMNAALAPLLYGQAIITAGVYVRRATGFALAPGAEDGKSPFVHTLEEVASQLNNNHVKGNTRVFIPLDMGGHWILAQADFTDGKLAALTARDSMSEIGVQAKLKASLEAFSFPKAEHFQVQVEATGQQKDGFRCGYFVAQTIYSELAPLHPLAKAKDLTVLDQAMFTAVSDGKGFKPPVFSNDPVSDTVRVQREAQIQADAALARELQKLYDTTPISKTGSKVDEAQLVKQAAQLAHSHHKTGAAFYDHQKAGVPADKKTSLDP